MTLNFIPTDDDICRNNHGGNANSEAANARTRKHRDRARMYAFVHERGLRGATCDEVIDALGMLQQTAYPRFSELKRDGDLIDTGQHRKTRVGQCKASVWITRGVAEAQAARAKQGRLL
jgi:hypothetical protein